LREILTQAYRSVRRRRRTSPGAIKLLGAGIAAHAPV
jgi:hypothetical protein